MGVDSTSMRSERSSFILNFPRSFSFARIDSAGFWLVHGRDVRLSKSWKETRRSAQIAGCFLLARIYHLNFHFAMSSMLTTWNETRPSFDLLKPMLLLLHTCCWMRSLLRGRPGGPHPGRAGRSDDITGLPDSWQSWWPSVHGWEGAIEQVLSKIASLCKSQDGLHFSGSGRAGEKRETLKIKRLVWIRCSQENCYYQITIRYLDYSCTVWICMMAQTWRMCPAWASHRNFWPGRPATLLWAM